MCVPCMVVPKISRTWTSADILLMKSTALYALLGMATAAAATHARRAVQDTDRKAVHTRSMLQAGDHGRLAVEGA